MTQFPQLAMAYPEASVVSALSGHPPVLRPGHPHCSGFPPLCQQQQLELSGQGAKPTNIPSLNVLPMAQGFTGVDIWKSSMFVEEAAF